VLRSIDAEPVELSRAFSIDLRSADRVVARVFDSHARMLLLAFGQARLATGVPGLARSLHGPSETPFKRASARYGGRFGREASRFEQPRITLRPLAL
jgi:hypothetical protein